MRGTAKVVLIGRRESPTAPENPRPKAKKGPATRTASPTETLSNRLATTAPALASDDAALEPVLND